MLNENVWMLMGRSCQDCNVTAVQILTREPTESDKSELKESMGGMFCIKVHSAMVEVDGNPIVIEEN
jgi:hypothetical protein